MATRLVTIYYLLVCISTSAFSQAPSRYDIVIDEIFPDPSPPIALPNSEFIELKNLSGVAYNMRGWKISNHSVTTAIKTDFILKPDSFLVICPSSSADAYSLFGSTIGISGFPSLDNDGDIISLQSPDGLTVHAARYDKASYQHSVKNQGGWSLEMIDTKNPCGTNNWKASEDARGGSPGIKNSIDGNNADQSAPILKRTYTIDSITIRAVFEAPLDSTVAAITENYRLDNDIGSPIAATPLAPLFNEVELKLPVKILTDKVYQLTANNLVNCAGTAIGMKNTARTGSPLVAGENDIVLNEILFNPGTNGYDYVEIYNRGNKIVDIKQLFIANKNISGVLNDPIQLSDQSFLFFPGDYLVLTENMQSLSQHYIVKNPDHVVEISSLPSMPDDHGNIILLNHLGTIVDALEYDHKWQFALINNEDGVALERIDFNEPTQKENNWTSASSTSGFGTPTYQNSQFRAGELSRGDIDIDPKIFSPDNNGIDDYCFINYNMPGPGYVANITVYDANGRAVRGLEKNALLGLNGRFKWDGTDDNQKKLSMGIYILVTEIYNLNGYTKKYKSAVVLSP